MNKGQDSGVWLAGGPYGSGAWCALAADAASGCWRTSCVGVRMLVACLAACLLLEAVASRVMRSACADGGGTTPKLTGAQGALDSRLGPDPGALSIWTLVLWSLGAPAPAHQHWRMPCAASRPCCARPAAAFRERPDGVCSSVRAAWRHQFYAGCAACMAASQQAVVELELTEAAAAAAAQRTAAAAALDLRRV